MRKQICIIGAGTAGIAAAYALRHTDYEVVLVEKRSYLKISSVQNFSETVYINIIY